VSDVDSNALMASGLRVIGALQWCCRRSSTFAMCTNAAVDIMHFAARTRGEASPASDRERTNVKATSQGRQEGKQLRTTTGGRFLKNGIDAALDTVFEVESFEFDEQSHYSSAFTRTPISCVPAHKAKAPALQRRSALQSPPPLVPGIAASGTSLQEPERVDVR
jgi:hypothetical protein